MSSPQYSIIIATYNEGNCIEALLNRIHLEAVNESFEIIIVDADSSDSTEAKSRAFQVKFLNSPRRQRAHQFNTGAKVAEGKILLFLHADGIPPKAFLKSISEALNQSYGAGCFRLKFDWNHWFLRFSAWFTRFNINAFRFGDQGFFIKKEIFEEIGAYNAKLNLMEDQEIVIRAKRKTRFIIIADRMITSARKYRNNGIYKLQFSYFRIWLKYYLGASQNDLRDAYQSSIKDSDN